MQIIIAMEKNRFSVFFLEIHSHKKKERRREYLHNMHSISANKTTTMKGKRRKKNDNRVEYLAADWCWCWSINTFVFYAAAMFSRETYASYAAFASKHILSFNVSAVTRPASRLFFFPQLYNVSGCLSIAGWKIIRTDVVCVHTQAKAEVAVEKKPEASFEIWFERVPAWFSVHQFVQNIQPALLLFARSSRRIFLIFLSLA